MKTIDIALHDEIRTILGSQKLAVLATERGGQPYSSLMAFAATKDLSAIVTATGSATRKYINLQQQPRVSLLIDTRTNSDSDFHQAAAITAIGRAREVGTSEEDELRQLYLAKHPYLDSFINAPSTILFNITIFHYLLVTRFQNVMEYHLREENDIFA